MTFLKNIRQQFLLIALCASSLFYVSSAHAENSVEQASANVVLELQAKLDLFTSVKAKFEQRVINQDMQLVEQLNGEFSLKRPGMFKWEYEEADQDIISDGENIYFLMSDLEQVIVQDFASALNNAPSLMLVLDSSKLDDIFEIKKTSAYGSTVQFVLKPKSDDVTYDSLLVTFQNDKLQALRMIDGLGQTTEILFSQVKYNGDVSASDFAFTAPEGYDVINNSGSQ